MSTPIPKQSLSGGCSVINDGTLYVLTKDAFQSLPLKVNGTWSSLPTGKAVTGAACARATPNGDESQAALYVVGGTSGDASFGGMQRFFFANQSWETMTPLTTDMKGRTDHSITYLNDSSSILVYAGSQPESKSTLSSQTFLISVNAPYDISSFTSQAPPANKPVLLPWNSSHAVMVGGEETNKRVYTFGPGDGWKALETNLTSALPSGAHAALISGNDGSKVLEVYDASKSPNEVQQLVLLGAGGTTASNGQTIGSSSSSSSATKTSSSRKRKRDLTISNWPQYNNTIAPTTKRSDYSVAQGSDGLAVISGGNDDEPLNIFNQRKNAWVDNNIFFNGEQSPLVSATPTPTSSATASATSTKPASTSTEPAGVEHATSNHTRRTLGITLGVLGGVALLFIAALLYMRWRKNRRKQEQQQLNDEKNSDRMSFADRGASFMKEAGGSMAGGSVVDNSSMPRPPRFPGQEDTRSSIAMFGGKNDPHMSKTGLPPLAPLAPPRAFQSHQTQGSQSSIAMFGGKNEPRGLLLPDTPDTPDTLVNPLVPPMHQFHDGTKNSHSSLAIIAGKFQRHSRSAGEKGSFESTTQLVKAPENADERGLELEEIGNKSIAPVTGMTRPADGHTAPAGAGAQAQQSAQPCPLQVKKRSSGWSKYFAPNDENAYQTAHQNSSNTSVSQYTASRAPSRIPSALVPPLDFHKDVEAQRFSAVAKGRPSFNHSGEDLAARGSSLDSVRPQTAAFHTGQSLEPESVLGGSTGRDSFDSRNSRRHSADSVSSRIVSTMFFGGSDTPVSTPGSAWTPMSGKQIGSGKNTGLQEVHIAPATPRIGMLQGESNSNNLNRPASSTYSASIAPGRDSRMDDLHAMSPPMMSSPQIPGPAARAALNGNSGFFPNNKDSYSHVPPRKLGALHPGTLAALNVAGISKDDLDSGRVRRVDPDAMMLNRDSNATIWPTQEEANGAPSLRYMTEQERVMVEKAEREMRDDEEKRVRMGGLSDRERVEQQARDMKQREMAQGTGTADSAMSGLSEYSWLNLGTQR